MPTQGSVLIDGIRFEVPSGVIVTARGSAVTLRNIVVRGGRIRATSTSSVRRYCSSRYRRTPPGMPIGTQNATANDSGDVDGGGNGQQNYPQLSKAQRLAPNVVRLSGLLLTQSPGPAQGYRLDLFWTDTCVAGNASGSRGELKRYIGFFNLFSNGSALVVPFSDLDIGAAAQIPGIGYLTATATDSAGDSSEPSPCFALDRNQ